MFQEMELSSPKLKKLLIFQEGICKALKRNKEKIGSEEISHISPKKLSSYFVMAAD